jgi:Spy/CpxP family protein refolding chaperone
MKLKLIALSTVSALSLGSVAVAQVPGGDNPDEHGWRSGGNRHGVLEATTERLNLTPEQKTKVRPIIDQTSPQIQAIRRDAERKIKR